MEIVKSKETRITATEAFALCKFWGLNFLNYCADRGGKDFASPFGYDPADVRHWIVYEN